MNLLLFALFLSAVFYRAFIVNSHAEIKPKKQTKEVAIKSPVKQFKQIDTEVSGLIDIHDCDTFKCKVKNKELMAVKKLILPI